MSYLTQMVALAVQNFVCAASGMAVLVALIRGIARKTTSTLGNFWVDLDARARSTSSCRSRSSSRSSSSRRASCRRSRATQHGRAAPGDQGRRRQRGHRPGPRASARPPRRIAIKQLGTNGGGFFNVELGAPVREPDAALELLRDASRSCSSSRRRSRYTFGKMVKDTRQGWAVLAAMFVVFLPLLWLCVVAGAGRQPGARVARTSTRPRARSRPAATWRARRCASASRLRRSSRRRRPAVSNGAVNAMHDSFTPLGGLVPLWLIQLGEIIFGGVGSGLYGMLMFAVVAVFVAGLMVGRTPEYLGKKIEANEMKMASLAILVPARAVLVFTAIAVVDRGRHARASPTPGRTASARSSTRSRRPRTTTAARSRGLTANTPFYNTTLGLAMFFGRFFVKIPVLALAGSLAQKKIVPASAGHAARRTRRSSSRCSSASSSSSAR